MNFCTRRNRPISFVNCHACAQSGHANHPSFCDVIKLAVESARIPCIMRQNDNEEKKQKSTSYRVITSIIFFTSLSMCVYQIYELILLYLSDPIETQMKVTMHDSIKFPAVTICNLNPVRRSRLVQFQVYIKVCIQVAFLVRSAFLHCYVLKLFSLLVLPIGRNGRLGLSLSLFIEQDEYMDRIAPAAGARVVLHDFHFKPLPDEEGFSVAPGYTTAISLQKVVYKKNKSIFKT